MMDASKEIVIKDLYPTVVSWNLEYGHDANGKRIDFDSKLIESTAKMFNLRQVRNSLLTSTDWVVIKEREEGGSVSNFADWKKYRQELRDITKKYKSLDKVKWPTAPSE